MRKWNSERGMSLVEATIILMVLAILTAVVSPSVGDYVADARNVKAKEDVEILGTGIARLLRDTGRTCLTTNGGACFQSTRVELLISGTTAGASASSAEISAASLGVAGNAASAGTVPANTASSTSLNWGGGANDPSPVQSFDRHLIDNGVSYTAISFASGGGPRNALGWRGAYVSGPVGFDPWGRKYQSNTVFLAIAVDAASAGTGDGQDAGGWTRDTIVLSPGANGLVETGFADVASKSAGDDIIFVIKGSTR